MLRASSVHMPRLVCEILEFHPYIRTFCPAHQFLPDDHGELVPPESISNSEVKRLSADGSVGFPHVRVGRCQAFKNAPHRFVFGAGFFVHRFTRGSDSNFDYKGTRRHKSVAKCKHSFSVTQSCPAIMLLALQHAVPCSRPRIRVQFADRYFMSTSRQS